MRRKILSMKEYHSYGIILFKNEKVLMVCRKDSIGFCEFVNGKYKNQEELEKLFSYMTKDELDVLVNGSFEDAYFRLWNTTEINLNNSYIGNQKYKFDFWRNIWHEVCVKKLESNSYYIDAEWGFPKGKKERGETEVDTALRELFEETQIDKNTIEVLDGKPLIECRKDGHCKYISHYYVAVVKDDILDDDMNITPQKNEISHIEFVNIDDAVHLIRPYLVERVKILQHLKKSLKNNFAAFTF